MENRCTCQAQEDLHNATRVYLRYLTIFSYATTHPQHSNHKPIPKSPHYNLNVPRKPIMSDPTPRIEVSLAALTPPSQSDKSTTYPSISILPLHTVPLHAPPALCPSRSPVFHSFWFSFLKEKVQRRGHGGAAICSLEIAQRGDFAHYDGRAAGGDEFCVWKRARTIAFEGQDMRFIDLFIGRVYVRRLHLSHQCPNSPPPPPPPPKTQHPRTPTPCCRYVQDPQSSPKKDSGLEGG